MRERNTCSSVAWSRLLFLPDVLHVVSAPLTPVPLAAVIPVLPCFLPGLLYSSSVGIAYAPRLSPPPPLLLQYLSCPVVCQVRFTPPLSTLPTCHTPTPAPIPVLPCYPPGPLYSSSVDIAYVRCKTPGSHRLNYTQWLKVLCILSDESGWDLFQLLMEHAYKLGSKGLPPPVVGVRGPTRLAFARPLGILVGTAVRCCRCMAIQASGLLPRADVVAALLAV